jgi:hypothetical protein
MERLYRLKITHPILVAGTRCDIGDVVEVDGETARDLLNGSNPPRVEIADEATREQFKQRAVRSTWSDPAEELERKPVLRMIKNAA